MALNSPLSVALISIARPTFDVALAQTVADTVLSQLIGAGFDVFGTGAELLMDAAGAEKAVQSLEEQEPDLVILVQASFADSSMAVQIAEAVHRAGTPLLLWAVPEDRDGGRLRLNSLCGINLAGHALARRQIAYDYVLAPADDAAALSKVTVLARAGHARRQLRRTKIGLVGEHPAGFDTCDYDGDELARRFGVQVAPLDLGETLQAAAGANEADRRAFLERVGTFTENLDELDPQAVRGTAGVYAALRERVNEQGLSGVAVRCWPEFFTELGCAACGAMSMLTEERTPASCEADVNGTLTLVLLQHLSGESVFITDLVSIDGASDTGVLWHCGLAPVSMADPEGPVRGTVHSNRKLPLLFEFTLKPGRVTLARLHHTPVGEGGYQLVIGGGEMVRAPKSFGGTSGVVRFDRPAREVFDTVMAAGLEHHFCIVYGDYREELRAFARLADLPVLELT
jgi:L-fucose isomerase-like protein